MNKEKWSRLTVVLPVETAADIRWLSERTNVPASAMVREFLAEPVAALRALVESADAAGGREQVLADLSAMVDAQYQAFREGVSHG